MATSILRSSISSFFLLLFYPSIGILSFSSLSLLFYLFCLLYTWHSTVPSSLQVSLISYNHPCLPHLQHAACSTRKTPCISLTHAHTHTSSLLSLWSTSLMHITHSYGHHAVVCSRHCPLSQLQFLGLHSHHGIHDDIKNTDTTKRNTATHHDLPVRQTSYLYGIIVSCCLIVVL